MEYNIINPCEISNINILDIILDIYKISKNPNNNHDYSLYHKYFGKVTYNLEKDEIIISFENIKESFRILKIPIEFIYEEDKKKINICTKNCLPEALKKFSRDYEFIVDSKSLTKNEILEKFPPSILLRKKGNIFELDIFKPLNQKNKISEEDKILLKTNELIPQNINSLGIFRNQKISLILKKRVDFIKEIINFVNSDEIIMKIYGCDGIGISVSFIYLTSLINNFKSIYFNLKEFRNKSKLEKIEIFKYQLMNFYTFDINKINNDKYIENILYNENFQNYKKFINALEFVKNKDEINFWDLINITIKNLENNFFHKILLIIDQYKKENDELNQLAELESNLIYEKDNIKILVASSLNDMKVKTDFINNLKDLKDYSNSNIYENEEFRIKLDNTNENILVHEENDIFLEYSQKEGLTELNKKDDIIFEKIKIFNDNDNKEDQKEKNKLNFRDNKDDLSLIKKDNSKISKQNNEKMKLCINNNDENTDTVKDNNTQAQSFRVNKKKYRIIYINKLISIENIDDESTEIIEKMREFDFNPKYYNKFKKFYNANINDSNLNDIYYNFILRIYNHIKSKIELFYKNLNKESNLSQNDIVKILMYLDNLVEEKTELNFNSLISYLNIFPLKYIEIIPQNEHKNKDFFLINEDLLSTKFKIKYAFPFIKFIISRIVFDYGNDRKINYIGLSSNGIGSLLEMEIRKALLANNNYIDFKIRNVWAFRKNLGFRKKKELDKKNSKKEIENKSIDEQEMTDSYVCKIDFFNFKEISYDDIVKNPLDNYNVNYYIIPHNMNNKFLDSIILIPSSLDNNNNKSFFLISLQITINKKKIYSLEEYTNETIIASNLIKEIYDINIIDNYFTFVLATDYNNSDTQKSLQILGIPFIFFSTFESYFYFDRNKEQRIDNIQQLLNEKFKIFNQIDFYKNESIYKKNILYHKMENLLKRKRKKDKKQITKDLFDFTRKKIIKDEIPLILSEEIENKIINHLNKIDFYKNKKIHLEYIFRANLCRIWELDDCDKFFLGIIFYKKNLFIINKELNSNIEMICSHENEKQSELLNLLMYINNIKKGKIDLNETIKKPDLKQLMNYYENKPSDIFVFRIYEINS